jgi:hypothetical protein
VCSIAWGRRLLNTGSSTEHSCPNCAGSRTAEAAPDAVTGDAILLIDKTGKVTLRYESRLYKIGLGRAHKGRQIKLLVADRDIRIIDTNGQLIRELILDPNRRYQPLTTNTNRP